MNFSSEEYQLLQGIFRKTRDQQLLIQSELNEVREQFEIERAKSEDAYLRGENVRILTNTDLKRALLAKQRELKKQFREQAEATGGSGEVNLSQIGENRVTTIRLTENEAFEAMNRDNQIMLATNPGEFENKFRQLKILPTPGQPNMPSVEQQADRYFNYVRDVLRQNPKKYAEALQTRDIVLPYQELAIAGFDVDAVAEEMLNPRS